MKRKRLKRALALFLGCILALAPCAPGKDLPLGMVSYAEERTASISATSLNVRSGPGTGNQAIAKLSQGSPVTVIGETTGSDGKVWYQIRFSGSGGAETTGYVLGQYVKFPTVITSSAEFEQYLTSQGFPDSYKPGLRELHEKYPKWTFTALHTGLDWNTAVENESVIGRNLVARDNISSWKSTAAGAYDWDTGTWPGFDGNSWVQASEDIIRYYMDPRNFLNEKYIYQFMKQSYDSSIHSKEGLESMVKGTFLSGSVLTGGSSYSGSSSSGSSSSGNSSSGGATGPGMSPTASISDHKTERVMTSYGPGMNGDSAATSETSSGVMIVAPGTFGSSSSGSVSAPGSSSSGRSSSSGSSSAPGSSSSGSSSSAGSSSGGSTAASYVDIIMNAASQSGVNPYILASMILQEQGSQGTGSSISGTVSGYQGYYNYFNIEAYQSGSMSAVQRGLWWASQSGSYNRPWNSVERSILGGAIYYGQNYVKQGQDTLYLKKFNVQGSNLYKHQYMTNVLAAAAEGLTLAKIDALKSTALEFSIPVYKNMPSTACVKPTLDGSPNNKLSGLGVEGFALTPTFSRDTESYDLIVDPSVASVKVVAAAIDSKAKVTGTGTVDLQSGINQVTVAVTAENGTVRNYVLNVVRQSNGPVYSDAIGSNVLTGSSSGSSTGPGGGSSSGGSSSGSISSGSSTGPGAGSSSGSTSSGSSSSSGSTSSGSTVVSGSAAQPGSGTSSSGTSGSRGPDGSGTMVSGGSSVVIISPADGSSSGTGSSSSPGGTFGSGSTSSPGGTSGSGSTSSPGSTSGSGSSSGAVVPGTSSADTSTGSSGSASASGQGTSGGDVNGDGKVNVMDVLAVQRHILGLESLTGSAAAAADVSGNNKVDVLDVLMLQKQILGIQTSN